MNPRPIFSDAVPILCLIFFQSTIGFVVALIDIAQGLASTNALYAACLQSLAALAYLAVRLIRRSRERAALVLAERNPLEAVLPESFGSTSRAWRRFAEACRTDSARLLAEREAASRRDLDAFVTTVHAMKAPVAALGLLADRSERIGAPLRPLDVKLEAEEMDRLLELALGRVRLADFERDSMVERADLRDLASASVRRARRLFIARGVSVRLGEPGVEVETDRKWMSFVLDQLIVNAAKYARSVVDIRFGSSDGAASISIEDDGPGIHSPDRDRLGTRSFVGAVGRDADGSGTPSSGYGLYLAGQAAEKLGVRLSLSAREGGGTNASVSFPASGGPLA